MSPRPAFTPRPAAVELHHLGPLHGLTVELQLLGPLAGLTVELHALGPEHARGPVQGTPRPPGHRAPEPRLPAHRAPAHRPHRRAFQRPARPYAPTRRPAGRWRPIRLPMPEHRPAPAMPRAAARGARR